MPRHRRSHVRTPVNVKKASIVGGAAATATFMAMSVGVPQAGAVSLPVIGEIPGTESVPLDVGELLSGFGGQVYVDIAKDLAEGDILALLNHTDPHRGADSQLVKILKNVSDRNFEGVLANLDGGIFLDVKDAIETGDVDGVVGALDGGILLDIRDAVQAGDPEALIGSLEGGDTILALVDAVQTGDWKKALEALDGGIFVDFADAVEKGDWVAAAAAVGAGPIFDLLALGGIDPQNLPNVLDGLGGLVNGAAGGDAADTSTVAVAQKQLVSSAAESDDTPAADTSADVKERPLLDALNATKTAAGDGSATDEDTAPVRGNRPLKTAVQNTRQTLSDAVSGAVDRLAGAADSITKSFGGNKGSDSSSSDSGSSSDKSSSAGSSSSDGGDK